MTEKTKLPLMEMFSTIQGEGYHQGKSSFFIRLGGCDIGCVWCDVKDSWDVKAHPQIEVEEILKEGCSFPARTLVITGGEPAMHNLEPLSQAFKNAGFTVHIETSGAYPLTGQLDWITLSPKKFKAAIPEVFQVADELKVIIYNKTDFDWAEKMAQKMEKKGHKLYLQPEWSRSETMVPSIVSYIRDNPQWEISLQIHKFMNIP